jgi:hypothetical protein
MLAIYCPGSSFFCVSSLGSQKNEAPFHNKYKEVFYPSGMPYLENPFSDKKQQSVYTFYDDVSELTSNLSVALYSESVSNDNSDSIYRVFVGVLSKDQPVLRVLKTLDVTNYLPTYTEFAGNFYRMDGRLNRVAVSKTNSIVHLNLWSVLQGTGSTSGASDLFFNVTGAGELRLILEISGTSSYSRTGSSSFTKKDSQLWASDLGSGVIELLVISRSIKETDKTREEQGPQASLYRITGDKYELLKTISRIEAIPQKANRVLLKRSPSINTINNQ